MVSKSIKQSLEAMLCPDCNSKDLDKDNHRAELICNNCGLVIDEELIDYGPEWRAFDREQNEKKVRIGAPMTPLLHDKGLTTSIGWKNRDYYGNKIPQKNRAQVYRLRKWHGRTRVSMQRERSLVKALTILDRMASSLSLPRIVRESAAIIYRKAVLKNLIRGRSIEGIAAAALYAACRQCDFPRSLNEIKQKANISRKEIGRSYRYISRELNLKLEPTSPNDYLSRFCSKLKLSNKTQEKAFEILEKAADKKLINGRGPIGISTAAIYMAGILTGERRTQSEIAETIGVTEVTIRNRYKELSEKLNIELIV
jgi:transcription initiation factor TFIIB